MQHPNMRPAVMLRQLPVKLQVQPGIAGWTYPHDLLVNQLTMQSFLANLYIYIYISESFPRKNMLGLPHGFSENTVPPMAQML